MLLQVDSSEKLNTCFKYLIQNSSIQQQQKRTIFVCESNEHKSKNLARLAVCFIF